MRKLTRTMQAPIQTGYLLVQTQFLFLRLQWKCKYDRDRLVLLKNKGIQERDNGMEWFAALVIRAMIILIRYEKNSLGMKEQEKVFS